MNNQQELINAINNKINVQFLYQGHIRLCSPHAIGYKNGKINVHVYQFGGMTSSGPITSDHPSNWRCMHFDQISQIEAIGGDWHSAPNHSVPASCIDQFIAEVKY